MKLLRLLWLSSPQTLCFQALRLIRMGRITLPREEIPSPELMVLSSTRVPSKVLLRLRALVTRHQLPLSPHLEVTQAQPRKGSTSNKLRLSKMLPSPILSLLVISLDFLQVQPRANIIIKAKEWAVEVFSPAQMQARARVVEEEARRKLLRFSNRPLSTDCSSA